MPIAVPMPMTTRKPKSDKVSPRQLQVLRLLCEGLTTREIATELKISFKTTAHHRHALLERANVRNVVELIRWAVQKGYVKF